MEVRSQAKLQVAVLSSSVTLLVKSADLFFCMPFPPYCLTDTRYVRHRRALQKSSRTHILGVQNWRSLTLRGAPAMAVHLGVDCIVVPSKLDAGYEMRGRAKTVCGV